jgi:hypothetical protein
MVVSAKANLAKSDPNFEQMIAVCFKTFPDYGQL